MVNKIKTFSLRFSTKPENRQRTVIIGLVAILVISLITYFVVINNQMFTAGYSQPFIDWLHTSGGKVFVVTYLLTLLVFILLSANKTRQLITKTLKKVKLPFKPFAKLRSRLTKRYAPSKTKKRKVRLVYLIGFVLLLIPFVLFTLINQSEAEAGWWNDNWVYRKRVTLTNSGSQQTDYQVYIEFDSSALISANKMKSDCSDIRIFDYAERKLITNPYWVGACNTTDTRVWIKMSTVPTTDTILYMYYGYPSAESAASSGDDVFMFYDDFDGTSVDATKWDYGNSGTGSDSITNGVLSITSTGDWWSTADTSRYIVAKDAITSDYTYEARIIDNGTIGYNRSMGLRASSATNSRMTAMAMDSGQTQAEMIERTSDGGSASSLGGTAAFSEPYYGKFTRDGTTHKGYVESTLIATTSAISNLDRVALTSTGGGTTQFDYVVVRKFASTEPSTSLSSEEVGPGPVAHWKFNEGFNKPLNQSITNNETQINIMNQEYSTSSSTAIPTDNSLGLFKWEAAKHSGATVYLEVDITSGQSGAWCDSDITGYADLYTSAGSLVGSTSSIECSGYQRSRSGALSLSDGTDYTVRLRGVNGVTATLRAAKLIVVQDDTSGITDTQVQVEVGNSEEQTSSTATQLTDKKIYYYDSTKFDPAPTAYFEATLKNADPTIEQQLNIINQEYSTTSGTANPTDNSLGLIRWDADEYNSETAYLEVIIQSGQSGAWCDSDTTGYADIYTSGGTLAGTATSLECMGYQRRRTAALTLTDDTDYTVRARSGAGTTTIRAARLIVIQSDSTKITDTVTQIEVGDNQSETNTSHQSLTNPKYYYYDSTQFSPAPTAYFEATFKPYSPKIEQHINIMDQEYYTTAAGPVPTDNSLGLVKWDSTKYTGDTVYFEASVYSPMSGPFCGSTHGYADLYTAGGSLVDSVDIIECGNLLQRTDSLSLTDGVEYTVRVRGSGAGVYVYNARLVVVQSDATRINETETQIEVGDYQTGFTNTSAAALTDEKIYMYDDDLFTPSVESSADASFSATLKIDSSGDTVYAELYNKTNSTVVATASHTGDTNWTLVTVNNIDSDSDWDTTNNDDYIVRVYCADGDTGGCSGNISNAKIILDQYSASGITALETTHHQVNSASTDADSTYTDQEAETLWDPTSHGAIPTVYYEATMKTSAGTGYAIIENDDDSATIASSEISTTSTSYTRVRTVSDIFTDLPTSSKKLDTQLKNSATNTTTASSSWLVVQYSNIPTSGTTGAVELYNKTDTSSVASSEVTSSSAGFTRVRSSSITLTTAKEYEVRLKTATLVSAKIVLDQTAAGGITDFETVQQQVNTLLTDTDDTYTSQEYLNQYNPGLETDELSFTGCDLNYYYEATLKTDAGTGYAQLYNDTDASAVSNSIVSTTSTSYSREITSDITSDLPQYPESSSKDMDTQIRNSASSGNTTSISNSWLKVQVSNLATAGVTVYADLYNLTDTAQVASSEVSSTDGSWERVRSSAITLTTDKEYVVRVRSSNNNVPVYISNAKIILDQTSSSGVLKTEAIHQNINTLKTDSDGTYTDQEYLGQYNPSTNNVNFGVNQGDIFFEATMKTSANTGNAILKNDTDTATITNSELSTTSTTYDRVTSSSIARNLPGTTKNIDTQIKNATSDTTSVASSWLVIQNDNSIPAATYDSSQNNHIGSISGASWQNTTECKYEKCLSYDGTDDYVAISDNDQLDFVASDSFTLIAWIKRADTSTEEIILSKYYSQSESDGGYKVSMNSNGQVVFGVDDDSTWSPDDTVTSSSTYDDGVWHHIAAVKDATTSIKLYVDGELQDTDSSISATGTLANTDNLYIGIDGDATSGAFEGLIDDVKVYPYARSVDEIKVDFISGSGVLGVKDESSLTDDLVVHWKFDETSANTCDDTNDACDSSGFYNHARWEDNASNTTGKFASAVDFDGTNDRVATSSANGIGGRTPGSWWDSGWDKRKLITVSNSGSALTDYQVNVTVVHETDMQSDFDDLRFTNSTGTLLDYWIEDFTASTTASVWIEVDSIGATGDTSVFMYYGNSGASAASNGDNTMVFFEDMDTTPSGTLKSNAYYDSSNDWTRLTTATNGVHGQLEYATTPSVGWATHWKQWTGSGTGADATYFYTNASSTPTNEDASINGYIFSTDEYADQLQVRYNGSLWTVAKTGIDNSAWHDVESVLYESGGTYYFELWYDDVQEISNSSSNTPSGSLMGWGARTGGSNNEHRVDDLFTRKYVSTEPTTSIGAEESDSMPPPITFSAWVKADTLGATNRVITARNNSDAYSWALYNDSANPGKLKFTFDGGNTYGVSSSTLSTGNWYHVLMTVDGSNTKLYINGSLDQEITNAGGLPGGDISIGADPDGTDGWDGKIDDVRIYSKTLDAGAAGELYALGSGPLAEWKMDEVSWTNDCSTDTVYDTSGNNYHGDSCPNTSGSTGGADGKYGKAGSFDGSEDYLSLNSHTSELNFTGAGTVEGWVKSSSDTSQKFYSLSLGGSSNRYFSISLGSATSYLTNELITVHRYLSGGSNDYIVGYTTTDRDELFDGNWHHIAVTFDTDSTKIYIDGVSKTVTTGNGTDSGIYGTTASIDDASIGSLITASTRQHYVNGSIDEAKVYDYARSPEQILEGINAGHPAPGSPVGSSAVHWKLDEGYGTVANNTGSQGSTFNGTISNADWTNDGKYLKALDFGDGEATEKYVYNSTLLDSTPEALTLSWWFNPANDINSSLATNAYMLAKTNIDLQDRVKCHFIASDGKIDCWTEAQNGGNKSVQSSTDSWSAGTWYHIVFTWDTTNGKRLYINGLLEGEASTETSLMSDGTFSNFFLGSADTSGYDFDGYLDDFRLYYSSMSPAQVTQIYNQGKSSVLGSMSTDSSGNASMSSDRSYCPPGDATSSCGPIAEWKMDENTGTSVYDTSGNGVTTTFSSAPVWQHAGNCAFGSCLKFDGSDDYLQNNSWDYSSIASAFTIDGWFYFNGSSSNAHMVSMYEGGAGVTDVNIHVYVNTSDQLCARSGDSDVAFNPTLCGSSISEGQWYHFSFIHDGTANTDYLYLDGDLIDSDTGNTDITGLETPRGIVIGENWENEGQSEHFPGRLDTIRVFDYAHTTSQIAWNYNKGKPVGYWKLNECQGTVANDSGSGGNNGTITEGGSGDNNGGVGSCSSGAGDEMWDNGTTGKRNASIDLDGTDDRSDTSVVSDFNLTGSDFSISAWIKTSQSSLGSYLAIRDTSGGGSGILAVFPLNVTSGKVSFDTWDYASNRVTSNTTVNDGQWHHVVGIFDASTGLASLYIDGKFDNSDTQSGSAPNVSKMVRLGGNINTGGAMTQPYDGQIDEAKVFNYALTTQQILTVFREGAVKF